MTEQENIFELLNDQINLGLQLITNLNHLEDIDGVSKLQRKIKQELNFLRKKQLNQTIKKENIQCSNLTYFTAVVEVILKVKNCKHVNHVLVCNEKKITIDIICNDGLEWIKVVARNSKSLSQAVNGDTSYGTRSIIQRGLDYVTCAQLHPVFYKIPQVIFYFAQGVEENIITELEQIGIKVVIKTFRNISELSKTKSNDVDILIPNLIETINLDVSSMIAYVSNLTNGHHNFIFKEPILSEQARWEAEKPVKKEMDSLFAGKKLICCETAYKNFQSILQVVGGPQEQNRGQNLLSTVEVLPDDFKLKNEQLIGTNKLQIGGKIKERSLLIFEFGDRAQAMTISANEGFIRAARQQGINFTCFIHESRALTEQKEITATKVDI